MLSGQISLYYYYCGTENVENHHQAKGSATNDLMWFTTVLCYLQSCGAFKLRNRFRILS